MIFSSPFRSSNRRKSIFFLEVKILLTFRQNSSFFGYPLFPQVEKRDGALGLHHFKRIKQLGNGDVGMVDLVQLDATPFK